MKILRLAASALIATAVLATVSACSAAGGEVRSAPGGVEGVTVRNCGEDVTFAEPPQRVMLLESAPVTILDGIGVFDRVISRAGQYPDAYYDDDLAAAVEKVPALTEQVDSSGHIMISQEEIIAQQPDLVLGLPDGVSRAALGDAGINVLEQELFCPSSSADASFDTLYDEIARFGRVFDREAAADALIDRLRSRVAAVSERTPAGDADTAVVLYPTTGGGTTYAYGSGSMAQPQLDALGLRNIFADQEERVFEVQPEVLIDADPDVIIVLHQGTAGDPATSIDGLVGGATLSAVEHGRVFNQLFNFTEPASPLTVTGLEKLADLLEKSDG